MGSLLKILLEQWARRREKKQYKADMKKLFNFVRRQQGNPAVLVYSPAVGSEDFEWAERLVIKGLLVRQPRGMGYSMSDENRLNETQ